MKQNSSAATQGSEKGSARPLLLSLAVVIVDQVSKSWVVAHIPEGTVGYKLFGDFLEIWHVRNTAVAFSMGSSLPPAAKAVFFILIPLVVLAAAAWFVVKGKDLTKKQRWYLALFVGGGTGNLIDRIFRQGRVVDFMANRVYGLFGMEFWPTWNFADASLVVSAILLALSVLFPKKKTTKVKE